MQAGFGFVYNIDQYLHALIGERGHLHSSFPDLLQLRTPQPDLHLLYFVSLWLQEVVSSDLQGWLEV